MYRQWRPWQVCTESLLSQHFVPMPSAGAISQCGQQAVRSKTVRRQSTQNTVTAANSTARRVPAEMIIQRQMVPTGKILEGRRSSFSARCWYLQPTLRYLCLRVAGWSGPPVLTCSHCSDWATNWEEETSCSDARQRQETLIFSETSSNGYWESSRR